MRVRTFLVCVAILKAALQEMAGEGKDMRDGFEKHFVFFLAIAMAFLKGLIHGHILSRTEMMHGLIR